MPRTRSVVMYAGIVLAAVGVTALIFFASLTSTGTRTISAVETIHGVPYPFVDGSRRVYESLAHADVYLTEPALAKELELTVSFRPHDVARLSVGIRENEFWLSYPLVLLYDMTRGDTSDDVITSVITIPLTDKLQDTDRSLDLMFVAAGAEQVALEDGEAFWELHDLTARVAYQQPNLAELRDYVRSVVKRERAL